MCVLKLMSFVWAFLGITKLGHEDTMYGDQHAYEMHFAVPYLLSLSFLLLKLALELSHNNAVPVLSKCLVQGLSRRQAFGSN